MTAIEIGSLILAIEFGLVAWGILFFLLRQHRNLKHADHHHAGAVMEELKNGEVDRRDALHDLFATTYRMEGEELDAKVEEYIEREKAFYNAMLSLYLERDGEKLKDMPAELTKVLAPWANMTPQGMIHTSEVGNLEEEKAELTTELETTKHTLEQLMEEYMAAFSKDKPPVSPPQKAVEPPQESVPETSAEASTPEPEMEAQAEPEPLLDMEAEPDEEAEIIPDMPTAEVDQEEPPEQEEEQFDILQENEDFDDLALSALGLEPGPASSAETPAVADIAEATDLEEESFDPPSEAETPDQEEPEQPVKKPESNSKPLDEGLDDPLAREELEGLADLFEPPSDHP